MKNQTTKNENELTNEELTMLSLGVLALINDANKALELVHSENSSTVIKNEIKKYVKLNNKICKMMQEGEK